jgi:two-component system cell cycle response regulator
MSDKPSPPPKPSPSPVRFPTAESGTHRKPMGIPQVRVTPSSPPRMSGPPGPRPSMIDLGWAEEDPSNTRITDASIPVPVMTTERNRAALVVINGLNAGQVFSADARETLVGRSRECHIRLDDVGISRQHCRILRNEDRSYVVEDLKSRNGTWVGGKRIESHTLRDGEDIQVGPSVVVRFQLVDEAEEQLARQLYESSTRDGLTKAYNRKHFIERLVAEVAYAKRHASRLSLVLFDLDHFKQVNDRHGHLVGDEVLRAVGQQVSKLIRAEDVFARYGGEEFVVLVRGIDTPNVIRFAERVRLGIASLRIKAKDAGDVTPTISAGVASIADCVDNPTSDGLLLVADRRLYRAKNEGRNRVCSSDSAP